MATSAPVGLPKPHTWRNLRGNARLVPSKSEMVRMSSRSPGVGKGGKTLSPFLGTLRLIDGAGLLDELLPRFLVRLPFEFLAALVRHIAQFVKNAALLDHRASIDPPSSPKASVVMSCVKNAR